MRTDPRRHPLLRLAVLLTAFFVCFGSSTYTAPVAVAADKPEYHADFGPDSGKDCPREFSDSCGIDKDGNYCDYFSIDNPSTCRMPEAGELPGTTEICTYPGQCSDEERKSVEKRKLEKWRETNLELVKKGDLKQEDFDKYFKYLDDCVAKDKPLEQCKGEAYKEFGPLGGDTLGDWVGKKISEIAQDALEEAAQYIGNAVVWLLEEFADVFNETSVIKLDSTGVKEPLGIATALSAALALFLLLLQFGKVAISQQGGPAATALSGLAKWALISSAYWTVTTTALQFSDAVSDWIISYSFDGNGSSSEQMKAKFGEMFGGLIIGGGGSATAGGALVTGQGVAAAAVAVVIVIGIVCILAIGALWIEMLLRQAGIMILVSTMPIVLVGQMSDTTKDWWPKARDALLALILMKPMITFCFAIGFFAIEQGEGVQNMIVGLVIFLMACFCWPAIAKFMTFSTLGSGASTAGGLISSVGSSATSASGAGSVGGGSGYTRALERDNSQTQSSGSNARGKRDFTNTTKGEVQSAFGKSGSAARGGLATRIAGPLGLGLQVVAASKDVLESSSANTAAHAGLGSASPGGRHVVVRPREPGMPGQPPLEHPGVPGTTPPREG
ncbi:hypothetical protein [Streptomyces sp. NPDC021139]|uniref:hypothetical protein n=1 Tax=unclassified Streptomyces TaxID=2593676 RepID=UPI0033E7542F